MSDFFILLYTFWFIRTLKYVLFWLYLWQLKEYHVGRFLDHFRTNQGKKILFNFVQIFKIALLFLFLLDYSFLGYMFFILALLYLSESIAFFRGIFKKTIKKPAFTLKTLFLTALSLLTVVLFLSWILNFDYADQLSWILAFDVLTPLIISLIVLMFQPFFVFARNIVLNKAKRKISKFTNLTVIAITGSYGKTSTKEFLTTILSLKFKVLSTKEHRNSEVGISKCILNELKPDHQFFVAEVGAYNKGKVKEVCDMLKPKIGIVTGINEQHLSLFGSMENLLSAEGGGELANCLSRYNRGSSTESGPKDGMLILNGENKYCLDLYKKVSINKKLYTIKRDRIASDIWTESLDVTTKIVSFVVINKEGEMNHIEANVLGKHNVQNLLAAILIAKELGMSFEEISRACKNIQPEQSGIILRKGKHGIDIIDSSYSANPTGVAAELEYLKLFTGKKVIVMPCLIELGEKSKEIHEQLGKKIAEVCDLAIITSKDRFEDIKKGAISCGMNPDSILLISNPEEIFNKITTFCTQGDSVLLEGRIPKQLIELLTK